MRTRYCISGALALLGALLLAPAPASAQSLSDGDYNVDLSVGVAMGSSRAIGMGGAFAAIAEGVDGAFWNPASFGSRALWEQRWFEWEITAEVFFPGAFADWDVYNNGLGRDRGPQSGLSLGLGLRFQFDNLGTGFVARRVRFNFESSTGEKLTIRSSMIHSGVAYGFLDGQLVLGVGLRWADLNFGYTDATSQTADVKFFGNGSFEVGGIIRPTERPWRLGVTLSPQVETPIYQDTGDAVPGIELPAFAYLPGRFQAGFAYQLGDRPFNQRYVRPKNVRERLAEELERQRCERERDQLLLELREADESPEGVACPLLTRHPTDEAWWEEENAVRETEDESFDDAVMEARRAIQLEQRQWYESLTRRYLLISGQLTIQSAVPDGVGVDAFLEQEYRPRGETASAGFALGLESEVVPGWLQLRVGTYVEPGRNSGVSPRPHGTAGFTLKLITWDFFGLLDPFTFRVNFAVDGASGFFNWGLGIGFWH